MITGSSFRRKETFVSDNVMPVMGFVVGGMYGTEAKCGGKTRLASMR
jgi:hypothetical protein